MAEKKKNRINFLNQHHSLELILVVGLFLGSGATFGFPWSKTPDNPIRVLGDTTAGTSVTSSPSCQFSRADYDANGRVDSIDEATYQSYRQLHSAAADINADGLNGNEADDLCIQAFKAATSTNTAPTLTIASPQADVILTGVVNIDVRSTILSTLNSVDLWFQVNSGSTYSRRYSVADLRDPSRPSASDRILIPFDTLALPGVSGGALWVCPANGTSTGCSPRLPFTVTNSFTLDTPASGQTLDRSLPISVSTSGRITNVELSLLEPASSGQPTEVLHDAIWTLDANGKFSKTLNISGLPAKEYSLEVTYVPVWQLAYGTLPKIKVSLRVTHATTTPAVPSTNSGTAPSANTPTTIGTTPNPVTSPPTSGSPVGTQLAAPVILSPRQNDQLYDLSAISGSTTRGNVVAIQLSRSTPAVALETVGEFRVPVSSGNFSLALPESLKPGAYVISVKAIDGNLKSELTRLNFRIAPPAIVWRTAAAVLRDRTTLELSTRGPFSEVEIFGVQGTLPELFLGRAQRISGTTDQWSLAIDTTTMKDGPMELAARGKALDGQYVRSSGLRVSVSNTPDSPANVKTPSVDPNRQPTASEPGADAPTAAQPTTSPSAPDTTAPAAGDALSSQIVVPVAAPESTARTVEDPRTSPSPVNEKLNVQGARNIIAEQEQNNGITLTGQGPANTIVTLFIYSDPIVVTTKTDANGNWTYTLEQTVADGRHEVYVTVTDDTGKIQERGNPFGFFVAQARAVTEEEFVRSTQNAGRESDRYLSLYLVIAGLGVLLAVSVFLVVKLTRHDRPAPG